MKLLILFLFTGCFLNEEYSDGTSGPGILTNELREERRVIKWRDIGSDQLIVIDSNAFYHYWELYFYDNETGNKNSQIFPYLGISRYLNEKGDSVRFDKDGALETLPEYVVPLEVWLNTQYLTE